MHASEIQEVCDDVVLLQPTIVYKPICSSVFINSIYRNIHSKAKFIGIEISSTPHIVWALWNEQYYGPPPTDVNLHPKFNERPVCVSTIMLHLHVLSFTCTSRSVVLVDNSVNENQQEWTLAHVSWPIQNDKLGKPAELWWCSIDITEHVFILFTIQLSRCAYADSMFVVPL